MAGLVRQHPAASEATRDERAPDDDAPLVAAAQRDPTAFASLYHRYVDPVYRFCYRRLGERTAAEDATSLVFLKALQALPRYRAGSFRSWLFAIAHNVVADCHRAPNPCRPLALIADRPAPDAEPGDAVLAAAETASLRNLIAHLPPEQRRVVELRLAGLSDGEIAGVLGR